MLIYGQDLYQFNSYVPQIDLTFHQYLLLADEPVLVHTGNIQQTEVLLPELKDILGNKVLKYIFISHFEADECGGLSLLIKHFPEAKPVCSQATARQLMGFGLINDAIAKKPGEKLITSNYEIEFFSYPSEMHLWEGLLAMENKREIFFSSDLMLGFGKEIGTVMQSDWQKEVSNISPEQIPDPDKRLSLQNTLTKLTPKFIATGHGPCLKL